MAAAVTAPDKAKMAALDAMAAQDVSGWTEKGFGPVVILSTMWNKEIVDALAEGCEKELLTLGLRSSDIVRQEVPGAYELPFAAQAAILARKEQRPSAVICIGVLIKGSTMHFEYICEAVTQGITRVGLDTKVPVIFGVLTCLTDDQAKLRAGFTVGETEGHNHGVDWGRSAVHMANLAAPMWAAIKE